MIQWNVDPVMFDLGFIAPRWYGILFAAAFIVSYYIMKWIFVREKRPIQDLDTLSIYMMVATILGARAGHMFFYEPDALLSDPLVFFAIWQGGLASHGGAIGIMAALWLFSRRRKGYSFMWLLDRLAIVAAISGMLIRIGNLMNSEIIGRPTNVGWAVWFRRVDPMPVYRHPAQIYEAILCLGLFLLLVMMYRRGAAEKTEGRLIGVFLLLLFTGRFLIEFLKERQVAFEAALPIDMGQILSLPFIAIGIWFLLRSRSVSAVTVR